MKKYVEPEMEKIALSTEDICVLSNYLSLDAEGSGENSWDIGAELGL